MKKRMKLKPPCFKNISTKDKVGIVFLIILTMTVYIFFLLNKKVTPILFDYAKHEATKLTTLVINNAIQNQFMKESQMENLVKTTLNSAGEIITVDFDTTLVNQSLGEITNKVYSNLQLLEEGKLDLIELNETQTIYKSQNIRDSKIYYIPFGVITDIPIIADIGPKIPVKISLIGSVVSNIKTDIESYGINNALLKVYIKVEVSQQVILPFLSKKVTTSLDVPVLIKVIQGKVPQVYGGAYSVNSPLVGSNG